MRITAIIAARNESRYLPHLFEYLIQDDIEIVYLDNDSTDDSLDIAYSFANLGNIAIDRIAYEGTFDLSRQLEAKARCFDQISDGWCVHLDADELLHSSRNHSSLRFALEVASHEGYNAVNFNEFVMLPADPCRTDYLNNNTNYYYFKPHDGPRLIRAWQAGHSFDNSADGGHMLSGHGIRLYPGSHVLRHYIVIDQQHASCKYSKRRFSRTDLKHNWHRNRMHISPKMMRIPTNHANLRRLSGLDNCEFDMSHPCDTHFWQW